MIQTQETGRTIAKNASVLMISQVITWGLTMLLTIFLPRYLGVSAVGKFHLANSLWAIAAILASFGMDLLVTKEIARDTDRTSELVGTSIFLRLILFALGFLGIGVYARMAGYAAETVHVIYIVGIANLFVQITSALESALKGLERMEFISLANIITKILITGGTILVLLLGYGVLIVALVGVVAAVANVLIQGFYLRRLQSLRFGFHRELVSWMLKTSFPYLMVYLFLVIYQQVDIVIMSLLVDEKNVGWYGAADQLFGTLLFIPTVFITAIYPALSRSFTSDESSLHTLMQKGFYLLLLACMPIGLGLLVISDQLVVLLYGDDFANSGPILAIFGLVLILTSQNILLGQFMISIDRQKTMVWIMAGSALLTVPLDLTLVPWSQKRFGIGAVGGALSFLITEMIMMAVILALMPRYMLRGQHLQVSMRSLVAGLAMVVAIWWARHIFIAVPILLGVLVYTVMILILKAIPKDDQEMLKRLIQDGLGRFRKKPSLS
jgi:O-antigen/teichoic acid export membrane protein